MNPPETRYIDRDGSSLAYQVGGDGPGEFLSAMELVQHLDLMWTDPDFHANFERAVRQARRPSETYWLRRIVHVQAFLLVPRC